MSDLLDQLAAARNRLIDSIEQPALADINARAAALRRRRRYLRTITPVVAALAVMLVAIHPWQARTGPQPAGRTPVATPPVWSGQGITLTGLAGVARDLPGNVFDVSYAGDDHVYALTADCTAGVEDCAVSFVESSDGGQLWSDPVPLTRAPAERLPRLWSMGTRLVVAGETAGGRVQAFTRLDGWSSGSYDLASLPSVPSVPAGGQVWLVPGSPGACPAGRLLAWSAENGTLVMLQNQPPIDACWASPVPADGGAWWVAGMQHGTGSTRGRPALAVSRDGGRTWAETVLPEPDAGGYRVRVATLGPNVYAAVLGPDGSNSIVAVYRSSDAGAQFTASRPARTATLSGDLVPLPDGRLLFAGTDRNWYACAKAGATFSPVPGLLPTARLTRTTAGYVAHNLLGGGWTAISPDGVRWHKIGII